MESQPQNPEFRINPEKFSPMRQTNLQDKQIKCIESQPQNPEFRITPEFFHP